MMSLRDQINDSNLFDEESRWCLRCVHHRGDNPQDDITVCLMFNHAGELINVTASSPISGADIRNAEREARKSVVGDVVDAVERALGRFK